MSLLEKQKLFSKFLARFLHDLHLRGYEVTMGETYRPPEMAEIYASQGKGIKNSLHTLKLAVDLNIFYQGTYLKTVEELEIPGRLWKAYTCSIAQTCWGGDFKVPDANHFSIFHNGFK